MHLTLHARDAILEFAQIGDEFIMLPVRCLVNLLVDVLDAPLRCADLCACLQCGYQPADRGD